MRSRPVTFVAATAVNGTTGTSIAIAPPAGIQQDDLLLAYIGRNRDEHDSSFPGSLTTVSVTGATWNIPDFRGDSANYADGGSPLPGWATRFCFNWRVAGASEPGSYTFNMTATPDNLICGVIVAYRYCQIVLDLNGSPWPYRAQSLVAATGVGSSLTGVGDGRLVTISSRGTPTFPAGTQRATANASSTIFVSVADELLTAPGATGTRTLSGGSAGVTPEVVGSAILQPLIDAPPALML